MSCVKNLLTRGIGTELRWMVLAIIIWTNLVTPHTSQNHNSWNWRITEVRRERWHFWHVCPKGLLLSGKKFGNTALLRSCYWLCMAICFPYYERRERKRTTGQWCVCAFIMGLLTVRRIGKIGEYWKWAWKEHEKNWSRPTVIARTVPCNYLCLSIQFIPHFTLARLGDTRN